jgi:hypothetical protein
MPTKLTLSFAALVALGALSGCHHVTIVSFTVEGAEAPPEIDQLVVEAFPQKSAIYLRAMNETVGFYDLNTGVTIRASGCRGSKVVLYKATTYDAPTDRLRIDLTARRGDEGCPTPDDLGGLVYHLGMGGMGGQTILPGTGGAAGTPDGGSADQTGTGGTTGSGGANSSGGSDGSIGGGGGAAGECDDGGLHDDAGLPACVPPTGDPAPGEIPMVTATQNCKDYCSMVFTTQPGGALVCPGLYQNITECQQFCTQAGWPLPDNATDSIMCREKYLGRAVGLIGVGLEMACEAAGPINGDPTACQNSDGVCGKFCRALAGICRVEANACIDTCAGAAAGKVTCRAPWLLRAASDTRYCKLLDPTVVPSCVVPGC